MKAVKKIRRCGEDREDFNRNDGAIWPMSIQKGGPSYGFCPGKATWSHEASDLMSIVEISYYTKSLFFPGSISEQPSWFIELLKDMLPLYDGSKSAQTQNAMWGGGSDSKPAKGSSKQSSRRGRR